MSSDRSLDHSIHSHEIVLQQAALLLQPALIRLIDQLRKHLERSPWQGDYETQEVWPAGTSPEVQSHVKALQQQLETAAPEQIQALNQALDPLPEPQLLYLLHLTHQEQHHQFNLWELCYQICFKNYTPCLEREIIANFPLDQIEIDSELFDSQGEVDWHRLDQKAEQVVAQAFTQLPPSPRSDKSQSMGSIK